MQAFGRFFQSAVIVDVLVSKVQEQQSKRLEQIENRDGEKWRKAMAYIGTAILGAVLAIVFAKIGL